MLGKIQQKLKTVDVIEAARIAGCALGHSSYGWSRWKSATLNKQIAFDLGVVEKTVKVHRRRMWES